MHYPYLEAIAADNGSLKMQCCDHSILYLNNEYPNDDTIREYGSTLYVGLARAISPTNTKFRLTFLLTRLQEALYEDLAV